jgi:Leucine-rich repeat (LRR) protein
VLDKNQLSDLSNFPPLPTLKTLSLNNNSITDLPALMDQIACLFPNVVRRVIREIK